MTANTDIPAETKRTRVGLMIALAGAAGLLATGVFIRQEFPLWFGVSLVDFFAHNGAYPDGHRWIVFYPFLPAAVLLGLGLARLCFRSERANDRLGWAAVALMLAVFISMDIYAVYKIPESWVCAFFPLVVTGIATFALAETWAAPPRTRHALCVGITGAWYSVVCIYMLFEQAERWCAGWPWGYGETILSGTALVTPRLMIAAGGFIAAWGLWRPKAQARPAPARAGEIFAWAGLLGLAALCFDPWQWIGGIFANGFQMQVRLIYALISVTSLALLGIFILRWLAPSERVQRVLSHVACALVFMALAAVLAYRLAPERWNCWRCVPGPGWLIAGTAAVVYAWARGDARMRVAVCVMVAGFLSFHALFNAQFRLAGEWRDYTVYGGIVAFACMTMGGLMETWACAKRWRFAVAGLAVTAVAVMGYYTFVAPYPLVRVTLSWPSWTPDGKEIIFGRVWSYDKGDGSYDSDREVVKISPEGGRARRIVKDGWMPQCSRTLGLVGYIRRGKDRACGPGNAAIGRTDELCILDLKTGKTLALDGIEGDYGTGQQRWQWSPNGERIIYTNYLGGSRLTDPWGKETVHLNKKAFPDGTPGIAYWAWSSDGCIWATVTPFDSTGTTGYYRIDPATWQVTIESEKDEGKAMSGWRKLYRDAEGLPVHKLEKGERNNGPLDRVTYSWTVPSPDGRKVVYIGSGAPYWDTQMWGDRMWVYDRTTKKERLLLDYSYLERGK